MDMKLAVLVGDRMTTSSSVPASLRTHLSNPEVKFLVMHITELGQSHNRKSGYPYKSRIRVYGHIKELQENFDKRDKKSTDNLPA
jgi:hypothetical protein